MLAAGRNGSLLTWMHSTRNRVSNLIFSPFNYWLDLCFWSINSCDINIAMQFWANLLGRTRYCRKWIDVWCERPRTIIFWQGWFIPCALKKNCPQIVHVKTSEYNRCLSIWMHCDAQFFSYLWEKPLKQVNRRFVCGRHGIFHASWVGRVHTLQEIRMTTCTYCKVPVHIKTVNCSWAGSWWGQLCCVSCVFTEKFASVFLSVLFHGQDTTRALNKIYSNHRSCCSFQEVKKLQMHSTITMGSFEIWER